MVATIQDFIVAIEIGSSKVTGIAGRKQPDGAIQVLAHVQEPSETFIRKGRISNIDKMVSCIASLKEKMEKTLKASISKAYVGIGGMGMHTTPNAILHTYAERSKITQEDIDAVIDRNLNSAPFDREILETVAQEYKVGAQRTLEPVGMLAEQFEGNFLNIVANSSTSRQIRECFHSARLEVAEMPIAVLALVDVMTQENERRSGCVFVDMGAQTTSVAVFKNNLLRHLAVIPLGGANITSDIMSAFQIEESEAETIKLRYDFSLADGDYDTNETFSLSDGRAVKVAELRELVSARLEEIIANVEHQIELSRFGAGQLISGLILTGGVSETSNIEEAFRKLTNIGKVRVVSTPRIQIRAAKPDFNRNNSYTPAIALIDKGEENCCGGELGTGGTIFDDENARRKEDEERRRREAAEKEAAEKAAAEAAAEEERRKIEREERKRNSPWRKFYKKAKTWLEDSVNE